MISIIISAAVAVVVAVVGGYLTYLAATRGEKIKATATPYDQLGSRVSSLEKQVTGLQEDRWIDRSYITDMHEHWPHDRPFTVPWTPSWVAMRYGVTGRPHHPPTPGSLVEPPYRKDR